MEMFFRSLLTVDTKKGVMIHIIAQSRPGYLLDINILDVTQELIY